MAPAFASLFTSVHVKAEHDRHLFAGALLDLLGVGLDKLVGAQRISLRATHALGADGKAVRTHMQKSFDFLQVVDESSALAAARAARGAAGVDARADSSPALVPPVLVPRASLSGALCVQARAVQAGQKRAARESFVQQGAGASGSSNARFRPEVEEGEGDSD